jgi:hypothetical protein
MDVWRERTLALTYVLLAASVALIGPSLAGLGGSGPVLAVLLAAGALLASVRPAIADLDPVMGYDVGAYVKELWLGPVVAVAMVVVLAPGASAGELQSVGGLAGFVGMVNYFLRPLYFFLVDLVGRYVPDGQSD